MLPYRRTLKNLIGNTLGKDCRSGAEVGVWEGLTSHYLLKEISNLHLYMIDSFNPLYDLDGYPNHGFQIQQVMMHAVSKTEGFSNRRTVIIDDSTKAANLFRDESLDFVFLDAGHKYEAIKADIEAWTPKVRKGGLVSGHDYCARTARKYNFGVQKAVDEYVDINQCDLSLAANNIWYFVR